MMILKRSFSVIAVSILIILVCGTVTGTLDKGLYGILEQFPMFDVATGVIDLQGDVGNLLKSGDVWSVLLEMFELFSVLLIFDWVFDSICSYAQSSVKTNLLDSFFSMPLNFLTGIFVRVAIAVLLALCIQGIQTALGEAGRSLATVIVLTASLLLTMLLRPARKRKILATSIIIEMVCTLSMLVFCVSVYYGINGNEDISGIVYASLAVSILLSILKPVCCKIAESRI